jgi:regulator of sigma E protease
MLLILLGLLITILLHELGHFIIAKIVGCKVECLSIGFGKTIFKITYKGIYYKLNLLLIYNIIKYRLSSLII